MAACIETNIGVKATAASVPAHSDDFSQETLKTGVTGPLAAFNFSRHPEKYIQNQLITKHALKTRFDIHVRP